MTGIMSECSIGGSCGARSIRGTRELVSLGFFLAFAVWTIAKFGGGLLARIGTNWKTLYKNVFDTAS